MVTPTQDVQNAISEIISAQDAAWCAGDADAFGASALPDVVFTNVVGMFSVGVEPFNAQHAHIFSTIYKGSRLSQEIVHVTMVSDDVVIVDTLTSVTGFSQLPPGAVAIEGALRTRLEQVLVRRDGRWRVQAFHNVPVSPAAVSVARPDAQSTL
jgi:uncharacterized protein (TIGR02246 family)